MSDDELLVLIKYGTKGTAIFQWWGRTPTTEDQWELAIVKHWQYVAHLTRQGRTKE